MKIYNTLTREKQGFTPVRADRVSVYACGPTVYNKIHIGNARAICVFDTMRKYLKYRGNEVLFVQNFTDVDDRIIRLANEHGVTAKEYSEAMIAEYFTDARGLNVADADIHPKVTENIGIIVDIIQTLLDKGYAYESQGDVYFATEKFADYGKLSRNSLEDLREGASNRLDEESDKKRSPLDFALWKAAKPEEGCCWESPFGQGRPGWHIECSAMSRHYIGDTIDIHGGGADLIFPHHENEIAQSQAATGVPLAQFWVHNGMLNIDSVKMSKSKGNFFLVRDLAEQFGYEPLRFMLLAAHYRSQMNYTAEVIESAVRSVQRLRDCRRTCPQTAPREQDKATIDKYRADFIAAMDDDFNTANGIAVLFELVREINRGLPAAELFDEINGVLGLLYEEAGAVPQEVLDLVEQRKAAKAEKDYATADALRAQVAELGYVIEETRQGVNIKKA
ncbi:MAG: cysteine--tRNA ligase [Oscillospiraceae bacterium]|nr:cysteine--tRNA ligase [Oscillospiraceae bacterium]